LETISRITINPDVCHGKLTVRIMRYTVEMILDLLASGMSKQEIIEDYPSLENEDIDACLLFASKLTKLKSIHKTVA
jgi:uncharacterized protein (DUF433 family)